MRVAFLSHNAQAGDAIGRQLAEKVAFFLDRGADVRVLVESVRRLHPGLKPYARRVTADQLPAADRRFLDSADLIVVEYGQYYGLLDLLPLLAGGKARILVDYHGVTPPDLGGLNLRDALRRGERSRGLVWFADAAVVHSRFTAEELRAATDLPGESIHRLGFPLDLDWFSPGPATAPLREQLGHESARVLLFVGRLAPNKRVPVLVESLARLRDEQPPVHAWVVGDGGDCYEAERRRCRELAAERGVADRLHFLGRLDDARLRDAYRTADLLVMPSVHEGYCLPVAEAQACGLPVVAARAAALPETAGAGGLTFRPNDAADLARQVRRMLAPASPCPERSPKRIAVVAPRFGTDFVGGAERSLRTIAETLHGVGHRVEVFTTCAGGYGQYPEGTELVTGMPVHRFRAEVADAERFHDAAEAVRRHGADTDSETESAYLFHSLRSDRLLKALHEAGPFDAVIVGPYLHGLTRDVAEAFPDRTLLLPCFHDESFAWLPALRTAYERVGGILYHSRDEQCFAQTRLGINNPNAVCIGTWLEPPAEADPNVGRAKVSAGRRYLLYSGRYSREKNLPKLLDYAGRYAAAHPERFVFAFTGQGDVAIPDEPWARDLGFVSVATLRDVTAGTDAVVNLSRNESLSLAVLEAQAAGVPVIVPADNPVLTAHLCRGGGQAVGSFEEFAAALDDLWQNPERWHESGEQGRSYVAETFGNRETYAAKLEAALCGLDTPLCELARQAGLKRAAASVRSVWREQFGQLVERVLDTPVRPSEGSLEIEPGLDRLSASADEATLLIPVRLRQRGRFPAAAEGPGRTELLSQVFNDAGVPVGPVAVTPLPDLLAPGQSAAAVVQVRVPPTAGQYSVALWTQRRQPTPPIPTGGTEANRLPDLRLSLVVRAADPSAAQRPPSAELLLTAARRNLTVALQAAHAARRLPDGYTDVSEGWGARWKRWLKQKLLHNFQHAYVNVLSRQQSDFNQQAFNALVELADGQATLGHALKTVRPADEAAAESQPEPASDELRAARRRIRRLERRIARLERERSSRPHVETQANG